MGFCDDFDGPCLDRSVWFPHYLPAWSSRDASVANYTMHDSCVRLFIPSDAPLWCAEDHPEPLRVSGIASGSWSGPVGSTRGQQPFLPQQRVREEQPRLKGWLPQEGSVTIRCRMRLSVRSMAAMWLAGFEEDPTDSGELCVVEVFGRSVRDRSAKVGVGVKRKQDPRLVDDFVAPRLTIDVGDFHEYAVRWGRDQAEFSVDGVIAHRSTNATSYPMQVMIGVFDFPNWPSGEDDLAPEMDIDWVSGAG
jgi:Glycosyl hydrolases family 16